MLSLGKEVALGLNYYAFEYSVLMHLNNMLKIESINIDKETYSAMTKIRNGEGRLEDKIVMTYDMNSNITLNFYNNFRYCFNRKLLCDEYDYAKCTRKLNFSIRDVAEKIKDSVVREFVKLIVK